jgi:hypothetical protein
MGQTKCNTHIIVNYVSFKHNPNYNSICKFRWHQYNKTNKFFLFLGVVHALAWVKNISGPNHVCLSVCRVLPNNGTRRGCMGSRVGLEEQKNSCPRRKLNPGHSTTVSMSVAVITANTQGHKLMPAMYWPESHSRSPQTKRQPADLVVHVAHFFPQVQLLTSLQFVRYIIKSFLWNSRLLTSFIVLSSTHPVLEGSGMNPEM